MTTNQHQEILRTEGLSKFFPGVKALDNVDFSLRRGEIMALLGENGAGKSTLIKALTGVYHADRGTIWLEGQAISPKNTAHAQQLGIGTVYQEVNLLPNMSVADNLFIGREPKRFGLLRRKEMEKRATELMASYGFSLDVREPLNRFSVAMQQIVAICRAIDLSAKVLILDEPTASLDTQEVELLFDLMRQLRDRGVSLIFVTHFLDQVYQVSDRITVLRNGSFVGCRETCELPQIELVKMMLGRELDTHALQRAGRTLLSDKPVAAFKNYGKKGTIAPFDLEVRPGEIVGLAGLLGSGRTETAEVIFGIKPADSGTALIKGKPQNLRSPHQASVLGIGFCPEDRKTDGIIAAASVRENIILALQAQRGWLRPISRKEQQEIAERFIRQLGIRTPSTEQPIEFLSGGNQQKVLLSRWLLTRPQFLILDEPTSSLDDDEVAKLFKLMNRLKDEGVGIIFVTHFLEQVYEVCDRITVLRNGELVGEYEVKDLPRVMLVAKMMGKDFDDLADIKGDHAELKEFIPVIEAEGLSHKGTIKPFDMTINKGEVVGFTGLLGSGRSELVRAIYGADKADSGKLKVNGKEVKIHAPIDAMKLGMAYLPEDRKKDGIIADLSVRENIIIALQAKKGMFHPMSRKEMDEAADKYIKMLQIKTASRETPIKSLSGGNQQKVIIGRWLLTNPDFLILDEPTRGIDIGTKTEIQKLVLDLADQGMAVAFISSEVEEMLRTCSRMAVMRDGKKVGEISGDELSQEGIMKAIAGGEE